LELNPVFNVFNIDWLPNNGVSEMQTLETGTVMI